MGGKLTLGSLPDPVFEGTDWRSQVLTDRKANFMFPRILALSLLTATIANCSPNNSERARAGGGDQMSMMGEGDVPDQGNGGMMNRGMMDDAGSMGDMMTIRRLLSNHEQIEREVQNIPGGVRSVTVSDDPKITELIRRHVREMKARYSRGQPIRMMDPLFRELFRHRDRATLTIEDIPGGVRVSHTSDDPEVASLIRQHAHRFVSEAAEQGMERAMQPTELPEGYAPAN